MNKFCLLLCLVLMLNDSVKAQQPPAIEWQKNLGGIRNEYSQCIIQTNDGGYIAAAQTSSNDGDVSGNHNSASGTVDCWIVKLNKHGNKEWQKCLGGSNDDVPADIQNTTDGGYILAANTLSSDGDVPGNKGVNDYWIVKLNSTGDIVWSKTFGGTRNDLAHSVKQTNDGGYIVAGGVRSDDGDVTGNHSFDFYDAWIIKLDSTGDMQWQKSFGGTSDESAYSICQVENGNYVFAGGCNSNNGDISFNHGSSDFWVASLDTAGNLLWQKTFGGSSYEFASSMQKTRDSGFVVTGYTLSNNGNVTINHGGADYWIIKLDSIGNMQWEKSVGGTNNEYSYSVIQNSEGKYVITGYSYSTDGDITLNRGGIDAWIVMLSNSGLLEWQKSLGGTGNDYSVCLLQNVNDEYIVAAHTASSNGDVTGNHGGSDCWIIKLSNNVTLCPGAPSKTFIAGPYNTLYSYQWQLNTGTGYTNISNGINYSGTSTDTLTISNPPPSWYGFHYRCIVNNGVNTFGCDPYTLKFGVTWTGSVNNVWENPSNWSCNTLPDGYTDVIIPAGLINYPHISVNTSVYSLVLSPGANITLDPGVNLIITGP